MSEARVDRLTAQRGLLSSLLEGEADGSKAASLSRELRAIDAELAQLETPNARRTVDDLARRRKQRLSGSSDSDAAEVQ